MCECFTGTTPSCGLNCRLKSRDGEIWCPEKWKIERVQVSTQQENEKNQVYFGNTSGKKRINFEGKHTQDESSQKQFEWTEENVLLHLNQKQDGYG